MLSPSTPYIFWKSPSIPIKAKGELTHLQYFRSELCVLVHPPP